LLSVGSDLQRICSIFSLKSQYEGIVPNPQNPNKLHLGFIDHMMVNHTSYVVSSSFS